MDNRFTPPFDPYDKLEEHDILLQGHALCIERQSKLIKDQSLQLVQVSELLKETGRALVELHRQHLDLQQRLSHLEH